MARWFTRRRNERPCPWCARSLAAESERCEGCGGRIRARRNALTPPTPTDLEISDRATQGLARRD